MLPNEQEVMLLQEIWDRNGSCIAMFFPQNRVHEILMIPGATVSGFVADSLLVYYYSGAMMTEIIMQKQNSVGAPQLVEIKFW